MSMDEHVFGSGGATAPPAARGAGQYGNESDYVLVGTTRAGARVLGYGEDGVGKTKFGADAPDPVFAGLERGAEEYGVARNKKPFETWPQALDYARFYARGKHNRKTFVLDTLDAAEQLIIKHICHRDNGGNKGKLVTLLDGKPHIDGYGFGHGWEVALEEHKLLQAELEAMSLRGMHVLVLAHEGIHKQKNAEGFDYGIIGPAIDKLAMGLWVGWADAVLRFKYQLDVIDAGTEETKRAKMISTGKRIMQTQARGGYKAKNRYSLQAEMELSWFDFERVMEENHPALSVPLREKIKALLPRVPEAKRTTVHAWFRETGTSVAKLREGLGKIERMIAEAAAGGAPAGPAAAPSAAATDALGTDA